MLLPTEIRDSNTHLRAKSLSMKIAKKKLRIQSPLVNPIIGLERPLEKVRKMGDYIAIKYHNTPGDNESGSSETNLPYYGGGTLEEWLVWKDKLLKVLRGQGIVLRWR